MARRKKRSKIWSPNSFMWSWAMRVDKHTRSRIALRTAQLLIGATVCLLVGFGLQQLKRHVHNMPQFKGKQVTLALAQKPAWMDQSLGRQILYNSIEPVTDTLAQLRDQDQGHQIVTLVAQQLDKNPWIKAVVSVRQCYAGQLTATCLFREPQAAVQCRDIFRLVDQDGVVLPGKYRPADLQSANLLKITGIKGKIPRSGQRWTRMDLQAGLELVRILADQAYRDQITTIDVGNFGGRVDPLSSWIVLVTNNGGKIRWGRPAGQEMGLENSTAQKLSLLARVHQHYGLVDMDLGFVDIRRNPFQVDVPALVGRFGSTARR